MLDFALGFGSLIDSLEPGDSRVFEFTESEAFIRLSRVDESIEVTCSYSPGSARVDLEELRAAARTFIGDLGERLEAEHPELRRNVAFVSALRRGMARPDSRDHEAGHRVYDERVMMVRLARLSREAKTAFAAACAQRLLPLFDRYASPKGAVVHEEQLRDALDAAWRGASTDPIDAHRHLEETLALVPPDDPWSVEIGYAQNAAAAAAYALRTWLSDDPQQAVWAARQVYDAAELSFLQGAPELDLNDPIVEEDILSSLVVNVAVDAIDQTLIDVELSPSTWDELRTSAARDGQAWARSWR